jgi:hypothetical protein
MRILFVLVILAAGRATAADLRANAQVWEEVDVSASLSRDWKLTGMSVAREGDGIPNPSLWGGGLTLDRRFGDLTISVGDLAVVTRSAVTGKRTDVDLPLAALSYSWRIGGFKVSDRNRFEDLVGALGDPWRYRNRISVEHPLAHMAPIVSVFANEEGFYDLHAGSWSRSRAEVGLGLAVVRGADLKIYYLRQDNRSGLPRAVNALGVTWAFDLR